MVGGNLSAEIGQRPSLPVNNRVACQKFLRGLVVAAIVVGGNLSAEVGRRPYLLVNNRVACQNLLWGSGGATMVVVKLLYKLCSGKFSDVGTDPSYYDGEMKAKSKFEQQEEAIESYEDGR